MKKIIVMALFVSTFLFSACQKQAEMGDINMSDESSGTPALVSQAEMGDISIKDAWGRPSPVMAGNGAFYMTLANKGSADDTLVSASSPACATVEIHETYDKGNGVMGMRPVEGGIVIPASGMAELKPGGFHIMCIQTKPEFAPGKNVPLTLTFANIGEVTLEFPLAEK